MKYEYMARSLRLYHKDGDIITKVEAGRNQIIHRFMFDLKEVIGYDAQQLSEKMDGVVAQPLSRRSINTLGLNSKIPSFIPTFVTEFPFMPAREMGIQLLECAKEGQTSKVHELMRRAAPWTRDWVTNKTQYIWKCFAKLTNVRISYEISFFSLINVCL